MVVGVSVIVFFLQDKSCTFGIFVVPLQKISRYELYTSTCTLSILGIGRDVQGDRYRGQMSTCRYAGCGIDRPWQYVWYQGTTGLLQEGERQAQGGVGEGR